MTVPPNLPQDVSTATKHYPAPAQKIFHGIRAIIFRTAQSDPAVGELTETLKWGEPAYLTEASKSGSTIRLAWKAKNPDKFGIYLNCQTTLVETMRLNYPDSFQYQGERALLISLNARLPVAALEFCTHLAQTYHNSKKTG
jgi:hypothetical protein